jgi:MFS family permease
MYVFLLVFLTVALMLGWGLVTMFMGWTHNLSGLIACRWFLGVFEAGLLPGCVYVIAMWYKRHEGISLGGSLTFSAKTNDVLLFVGDDGGCFCWVYS